MKLNVLISTLLLLAACDDADESALDVRVYGEEYIEAGIPADVFVDGWSVEFTSFLVSVGEVDVASGTAAPALTQSGFQIFDLAQASSGEGQLVASGLVPSGRYDDTQFVVAPAADAVAGNASADEVKRMKDGGYSVYVAGTASKGEQSITFAWGFATHTGYSKCESLATVDGATPAKVQLTIHGDHLFYDDLFSKTPNVSFDLVASADLDADGEVTQAELTAVDLRPLANYQVGSTDIVDLWHFIEHQTTSLGHIDGEGHCEAVRES